MFIFKNAIKLTKDRSMTIKVYNKLFQYSLGGHQHPREVKDVVAFFGLVSAADTAASINANDQICMLYNKKGLDYIKTDDDIG